MTVKELEDWLPTEESKSVGQKDDDGEAIGHKSGKENYRSSAKAIAMTIHGRRF